MNKKSIYLLTILLSLFIHPEIKGQCYELLWSDEFDYSGNPDSTFWTAEVGGGGWGNNELQYYTSNDPDNAYVENGLLTITAIKENYEGNQYTSARLITRGKFNVQYGKIEARMKLPYGQGIWPAFWMMGESITDLGWPACGEIDIMELVGGDDRDNISHGTAHWDNNGSHASYGTSYTLSSGIFAYDFHTFSIEWSPSAIRWYIDDVQFHVIDITSSGLSEFHDDFFILLNLAVGGNWPGSPDTSTVFPQTLEIDYVRVYKNTDDVALIDISGDSVFSDKAFSKTFSLPYSPNWTYSWTLPSDAEILSGQDSSELTVNWGCGDGLVECEVIGSCGSYSFSKAIQTASSIKGPMFISDNEKNVLFYTDSTIGSTLLWTVPDDVTIISGQGTDSLIVNWGSSFEPVSLNITNSCGTKSAEYITTREDQYPFPDIFSAHRIPGTLDPTNFDFGGEGVAYHDLTVGNNGGGPRQDTDVDTENGDAGSPNVGWIENGEWLEYSIQVDSSAYYKIVARVATNNSSGGPFSMAFNDVELLTSPSISNTGAWTTFKRLEAGVAFLTKEDTLMRIKFNKGGFNLAKLTFSITTEPEGILNSGQHNKLQVYPVPVTSTVQLKSALAIAEITILDIQGRLLVKQNNLNDRSASIQMGGFPEGIYIVHVTMASGESYFEKIIKNTE